MSNTLSETVIRAEPAGTSPARRSAWRRWPRRSLLFLASLWLAQSAISLAIQHTRLRAVLTSRLEAAFGRPVEVGSYRFSLWGPTLEAQSIIVGEDPRFGREYFLHAERLTMRLRWQSLLRGRLELGRLSLARPSLNLVRSADGDWNLAEWLPHPAGAAGMGPATPASLRTQSALRFTRISVESGRINFKRGDEKLPFAFVGVKGYIEPEGPGRWRMDLEAAPSRAAVILQQAGLLHLTGQVGGTSSRLRPAVLEVSWRDASVSDLLRLARSYDFGVRGTLGLALTARTDANDWLLQGRAELRQLHRWDLPLRGDNPALNLIAKMRWNPIVSEISLEDLTFEAPHSNAQARAEIFWGARRIPQKRPVSPFGLEVRSAVIDLGDLLSWIRAFHPGVAEDVSVRGVLEASGFFSGWPVRVVNARVDNVGADLTASGLRVPIHLGELDLHYDHGLDHLDPLTLSFGATDGTLRLEATRKPHTNGLSALGVSGNLKQVQDLVSSAAALGWNAFRGWDASGPARCDLRWLGGKLPWQAWPVGFLEWGSEVTGASLRAPFLNGLVEGIKARAEWKPGVGHISLTSAEAFGARWNGTFERRDPDGGWRFALAADHLAASDLDRWLNPRWRESFLGRTLSSLSQHSSAVATLENLRASGKIAVDQFTLAPFALRRLQGDLKIEGRQLALANAKADFYGGKIGGSLDAALDAAPSYHASFDFSRVDVEALTAATQGLANLFAGSASGKIAFAARGATRVDLLASLTCQGKTNVLLPVLRSIDLSGSPADAVILPESTRFNWAETAFSCAQKSIRLHDLRLIDVDTGISGSGSVDFSRDFDLQLAPYSAISQTAGPTYHLTGTLAAPRITRATAPSARP